MINHTSRAHTYRSISNSGSGSRRRGNSSQRRDHNDVITAKRNKNCETQIIKANSTTSNNRKSYQ